MRLVPTECSAVTVSTTTPACGTGTLVARLVIKA